MCVCTHTSVWSCQLFKAAPVDWFVMLLTGCFSFYPGQSLFSPQHTHKHSVGLSVCAGSNCCPGFRIAICQSHSLCVGKLCGAFFFSACLSLCLCVNICLFFLFNTPVLPGPIVLCVCGWVDTYVVWG